MKARLGWFIAIAGAGSIALSAAAQGPSKLAVGPDAGGYLCPDGRQLYVKSCYDNSPDANCGVVNMHLPAQNGFQRESTETRSKLTPSVAACKVYPLEFRNDGTVGLVVPKSAAPAQTAKAPAAAAAPKTSTATPSQTSGDALDLTVPDGMAFGYTNVPSSLVRISTPGNNNSVFYVDEASRKPTGQKDTVAIWVLQVWPEGNPSAASVGAVWTEMNANCKQKSYELTLGILLDREAKVLSLDAMNGGGSASKDVTAGTPFNIACKTFTPSKGLRFASAKAAIADAFAGAAPKTAAKPATPAAKPVVVAKPTKAPIRLPETETEKKVFEFIKSNLLQAAVSAILRSPDGKLTTLTQLTDEQGMTALHWVAANRNAAGTRWLLDKGPKVDLADEQGRTPLKIALDHKETRVMILLLDQGANPNFAWPGHADELEGFKKTSELVDFLIKNAVPAKN
jgi:Ankyrin repeats (3 copies)